MNSRRDWGHARTMLNYVVDVNKVNQKILL